MSDSAQIFGQVGEYDLTTEFGRISFMIQQALGAARFVFAPAHVKGSYISAAPRSLT